MYSKSTSPNSGHTASVLCAIAQISLRQTSYVHRALYESNFRHLVATFIKNGEK